jgi:hypothetical protein
LANIAGKKRRVSGGFVEVDDNGSVTIELMAAGRSAGVSCLGWRARFVCKTWLAGLAGATLPQGRRSDEKSIDLTYKLSMAHDADSLHQALL